MQVVLEHLYVNRELHRVIFESICEKYDLTITEIMILLLLDQKQIDTAKEIAMKFKIAKSHLSTSIRNLEDKGLIYGEYVGNDHRTIHLCLCDHAKEIVEDSTYAYQNFFGILMNDFEEDEKVQVLNYLKRMVENANVFLNK